MNWTGKPSVFFAVLALVLTGLLAVPAHAEPLNGRSGEESGFFYPSFPLEGGPHIIGASFWDGAVSDTTGDLD